MNKILSVLLLALSMQARSQDKVEEKRVGMLNENQTSLNSYATPPAFRTYCAGTVKYEDPIWIIDGVVHERPVKNLDPAIIDSIWILKSTPGIISCSGASRAVIVITTKKRSSPEVRKIQNPLTSASGLNVYPNPLPSGQSLTIKTNRFNSNFYLRIVSSEGKTVLTEKCNAMKEMVIKPAAEWKPGSYFIQYLDNKMSILTSSQIIIQ